MARLLGLSWDNFQKNVCSKFATLQQNEEFVDLTLAADGHLVKVHQLLLGIASPYIRQLLQSAPCKHPVIFLNNISYSTLSNILQYIYTGEATIEEEQLPAFFQAAKALQILGIGTSDPKVDAVEAAPEVSPGLETVQIQVFNEKSLLSHYEKVDVPISAKNITLSSVPPKGVSSAPPLQSSPTPLTPSLTQADKNKRVSDVSAAICDMEMSDTSELEVLEEELEALEEAGAVARCSRTNSNEDFHLSGLVSAPLNTNISGNELQYTVSIRGSLQLILNRFIYNLFSKSGGGQVRRWRCVDYKVQRCPACTITSGDMVLKRMNMHNHPFHDYKILGKIRKKAVFSTMKLISSNSTNSKS